MPVISKKRRLRVLDTALIVNNVDTTSSLEATEAACPQTFAKFVGDDEKPWPDNLTKLPEYAEEFDIDRVNVNTRNVLLTLTAIMNIFKTMRCNKRGVE